MSNRAGVGWYGSPWTLAAFGALVLLNVGALSAWPGGTADLPALLQFDGAAIRAGEWWRLLTGNLVHWGPEQFALDLGAFLALGLLYERYFRGLYPWLLLCLAAAVGVAGLLFWEEHTQCRGLSGVSAGQFAAALCVEVALAWRSPRRWLWAAPATAIFLTWLISQGTTGWSVVGALSPSSSVRPAPLAHAAGALAAVAFVGVMTLAGRRPQAPRP